MATSAVDNRPGIEDDPEAIRAEMAATRAALGGRLAVLKHRLFGTPLSTGKGATTVAKTSAKGGKSKGKPAAAGSRGSSARTKTSAKGGKSKGKPAAVAAASRRSSARKTSAAKKSTPAGTARAR